MDSRQYPINKGFVHAKIPISKLVSSISVASILKVARAHHIQIGSHVQKLDLPPFFENHNCLSCNLFTTVLIFCDTCASKARKHMNDIYTHGPPGHKGKIRAVKHDVKKHESVEPSNNVPGKSKTKAESLKSISPVVIPPIPLLETDADPDEIAYFPPKPAPESLNHQVIKDFCDDLQPHIFEEAGCAVCSLLCPLTTISQLKGVKGMLGVLESPGTTRIERKNPSDLI
jgi:hypothetical protein